jgi:YggT family protein
VRASSASVIGDQAELYGRRGTAKKPEHAAVGGLSASILLADWVSSAQNFVQVFTLVYFLLIFAYILMSWVRLPYSIWVNRIQRFLYDVCEPYLRIFRRFVPPLGPIDLSPMVAILVLWIASSIVVSLLGRFD